MAYQKGELRRWRNENWTKMIGSHKVISTCIPSGKPGFDSRREAQGERLFQQKKDNIPLRIYRCKHCHKYHLTSKVDKTKSVIL